MTVYVSESAVDDITAPLHCLSITESDRRLKIIYESASDLFYSDINRRHQEIDIRIFYSGLSKCQFDINSDTYEQIISEQEVVLHYLNARDVFFGKRFDLG